MAITKREEVIEQIKEIPEDFIDEILEFLNYLMFKKYRLETAIASESVLAKDWSSPEEDAAWEHL